MPLKKERKKEQVCYLLLEKQNYKNSLLEFSLAQSAGAAEYTNCISA